jgi:hypothetical protein
MEARNINSPAKAQHSVKMCLTVRESAATIPLVFATPE